MLWEKKKMIENREKEREREITRKRVIRDFPFRLDPEVKLQLRQFRHLFPS